MPFSFSRIHNKNIPLTQDSHKISGNISKTKKQCKTINNVSQVCQVIKSFNFWIACVENLYDDDDSESGSGWISWFCDLEGHEFFVEVDEDYIRDNFNLHGLREKV